MRPATRMVSGNPKHQLRPLETTPHAVQANSRKNSELKDGDTWTLTIVNPDDSVFYQKSVTAIYEKRRFRGSGDFAGVEASCSTLAQ